MARMVKNGITYLIISLMSLQLWAQDKKLDVDINVNKKDSLWYQQPWVWVVGGAVFILLLAAILKGSSKKE